MAHVGIEPPTLFRARALTAIRLPLASCLDLATCCGVTFSLVNLKMRGGGDKVGVKNLCLRIRFHLIYDNWWGSRNRLGPSCEKGNMRKVVVLVSQSLLHN